MKASRAAHCGPALRASSTPSSNSPSAIKGSQSRSTRSSRSAMPGTPRSAATTTEVSSTRSPITRIHPRTVFVDDPRELRAILWAQERGSTSEGVPSFGPRRFAQPVDQGRSFRELRRRQRSQFLHDRLQRAHDASLGRPLPTASLASAIATRLRRTTSPWICGRAVSESAPCRAASPRPQRSGVRAGSLQATGTSFVRGAPGVLRPRVT